MVHGLFVGLHGLPIFTDISVETNLISVCKLIHLTMVTFKAGIKLEFTGINSLQQPYC